MVTSADSRAVRQDVALAVAVGALWVVVVSVASGWDYWHPRWIESYWWAGAWLMVPMALRRLAPGAAFWATAVGYPISYLLLIQGSDLQSDFHVVPVLVAAFAVTQAGSLRAWLAGVISIGSIVLMEAGFAGLADLLHGGGVGGLSRHPSHALLLATLAAAATVLGMLFQRLAATSASLAQRNVALEALQELRAREAVRSERTRIARELHDVVAHHVSAIVVRAQAADHVGDDDPGACRDAVRWIAPAGREALESMRSVVRVLRDDVVESGATPLTGRLRGSTDLAPPMTPQLGLVDLGAVIDRVRGAGLEVSAELPAVLPACSPAVGLAVVRVAQEALTNVLMHSGATRVDVRLTAPPGGLVLQVRDPGPARPQTGEARQRHGLLNMHERAAGCGGEVMAGPAVDGGWVVRMAVPYSDD
ncbi:MAG: sensor histidine kinase [Cellulomonas sp.]